MPRTTGPMATPTCGHPDRDVKARGLCKPCWTKEQRANWASASTAAKIGDLGPGTLVRFGRQATVHEVVGTVAGLAKLWDQATVDVDQVRLYVSPGPMTCSECALAKAAKPNRVTVAQATAIVDSLHDISGAQYPDDPDQSAGPAADVGKVACPDCAKEVSKANLARHRKTHAA